MIIPVRVEDRDYDDNNHPFGDDTNFRVMVSKVAELTREISFMVIKDDKDEYHINPELNTAISTLSEDNMSYIRNIVNNLNDIRHVEDNLSVINVVKNLKDSIDYVVSNGSMLNELKSFIPEMKTFKTDVCISVDRIKNFSNRSRVYHDKIISDFNNKIVPKVDLLNKDITQLDSKLKHDIEAIETTYRDEIAYFNYEHKIKVERMCRECTSYRTINHQLKQIVWHIPKPCCMNIVKAGDIPSDVVSKAVDNYLATLQYGGGNPQALITQTEINQIVGQGLANGNIPLPTTDISKLGTMLGKVDTYATLPEIDQLGNPATVDDVAYLNKDDGEHKKGFYRYLGCNTKWEYLVGGSSTNELPTQEELHNAIGVNNG